VQLRVFAAYALATSQKNVITIDKKDINS